MWEHIYDVILVEIIKLVTSIKNWLEIKTKTIIINIDLQYSFQRNCTLT